MDNRMVARNLNLNRLMIFVAVAEAGSITGAALRLGLVKTAVSSHLQKLESEVGAALMIRTTRQIRLTEAGRTFFEACRLILSDISNAVSEIDQNATDVRGSLRITTSEEYGASVIAPIAARLTKQYPMLRIELVASDRIIDITAENIDVAIRLGWLRDSSQQSTSQAAWVATLKTPEDLLQKKLLALSALAHPTTWTFSAASGDTKQVKFDSSLTATTTSVLKVAALTSDDLAILPNYAVQDEIDAGRLMRVLPAWSLPAGEIHAVFPPSRYRPLKVRIFLEALRAAILPTK
jgi:DNA-binding transcriptional LysR family regulator